MDSQRFDASKRRVRFSAIHPFTIVDLPIFQTNRLHLNIQTGIIDEEEASFSSSSSPPPSPSAGSWITFARDSSPEVSDSASDSLESSSPPSSVNSSVTLEDDIDPKVVRQTDVFDKGNSVTTRTIIRAIPRSPILPGCFSRPSSPVTSRASSPLGFARASSPINFAALNCFSTTDAFAEETDYLQVQRARELEGMGEVEVHVHQEIHTEIEAPWIVQKVVNPEGLRRRAMEPRGIVSSP